ncbi:restriction endonuclease [Streptomyces sp. URMC 126]|uniref:restriction endonuclease n=1 Tax=Streptomyces sp. URMC 126 TaxID=3423401 RepID=UPI003F1D96F4
MTRRSNGLIGIWAEAQRAQNRQQELRHRAEVQEQRERERAQRAAEREAARLDRQRRAAYRQAREAEARRRTEELEARVAELEGLLRTGCAAPAFSAARLTEPEVLEPFNPGHLGVPAPLPDPARYGFGRRSQYERDLRAAQEAEALRQRQLAGYRQQYDQWAAARLAQIRQHNAGVAELVAALRAGDPDAVVEYFSAALYSSSAWPEEFPHQVSAAYDPGARQLVMEWELPGFEVVPEVKAVRYMPTADQEKETARPVTQRRALYRDVVAQCVLLAVRELFAADEFGTLESVVLNGFVDDHDPVTGRRARLVLAAVTVDRAAFGRLHLEQVSAPDCLVDGLGGRLSARPDQRTAVRAERTPDEVGRGVVSHGGADDDDPDLFEMDPVAFEALVAELFRARGMRAVMTTRSNDGGVDVEALDPDPISGGRIIVQVKRYRKTVPPTAVRDLFGTVQGAGANKGVLVTTSRFGPGSYAFANGKPLTLVNGEELVGLLAQHGLRGRLGPAGTDGGAASRTAAPAPGAGAGSDARPGPGPEGSSEDADHNVLGMSWSGGVALDVCALVCRGSRVLSEDHFVFYNNPRTPDGTVRSITPLPGDKAALRVAFDALPEPADRLVLAAAIDPEINPEADLARFTDARIRLADASGAELGQLEVSDGRPGETALVLGSFRKRSGGNWDFVVGGKGYPGGLEALVQEYGIEVA